MTWGRYDEHAPFHRKWLTLSNDAVATMWRATQWARSPEADARPGFVTKDELRALSGGLGRKRFERVLSELVHAGQPVHELGLLDPVGEGQFMIHDFEDYGPRGSRTQPEDDQRRQQTSAARAAAGRASVAARRNRHGSAQPPKPAADEWTPEQTGTYTAEQTSRTSSNKRPEQARTSSNTSGSDPEESLPAAAAAKDQTRSARERAAAAAPASPDQVAEKIKCPADLQLRSEQQDQLRAVGVPDYAITAGRARFLGNAGTQSQRSLSAWQNSLNTAIHGNWLDPKKRPSPPESFNKPGTAKTRPQEVYECVGADGKVSLVAL